MVQSHANASHTKCFKQVCEKLETLNESSTSLNKKQQATLLSCIQKLQKVYTSCQQPQRGGFWAPSAFADVKAANADAMNAPMITDQTHNPYSANYATAAQVNLAQSNSSFAGPNASMSSTDNLSTTLTNVVLPPLYGLYGGGKRKVKPISKK